MRQLILARNDFIRALAECGVNPAKGAAVFDEIQALGGVRLRELFGPTVRSSTDGDYDLVYDICGKIELKGPYLKRGTLEPLGEAVDAAAKLREANAAAAARPYLDWVVVDTLGLTDAQFAAMLKLPRHPKVKIFRLSNDSKVVR